MLVSFPSLLNPVPTAFSLSKAIDKVLNMLKNVESWLESSVSYHEETKDSGSDCIKLLSPTLALVTSAASNRASLQSSDECSSSSILSLLDGIVGNDEVSEQPLVNEGRQAATALMGIEDIKKSAEKVIASSMALSQTIMGHEATINSAKDMDLKSLGKSNTVLNTLELGDCERIEQYLQGLAVVQRAANIIIDHKKEISASVKEVQEFVKVNRLKSDSIPFLQSAKPVV